MVLSLSLLAIGLLAITTTADSAVQQPNHEWQAYGNTIDLGKWKRQLPEGGGGKCAAPMVRCHKTFNLGPTLGPHFIMILGTLP